MLTTNLEKSNQFSLNGELCKKRKNHFICCCIMLSCSYLCIFLCVRWNVHVHYILHIFSVMISAVSAFKARYICKYHIAEKKHDQWLFKFVMNVFFNVCLWITSGKIAVVILPHSGSHLESIYEKSNMRIFSKEQILSILTVFFYDQFPSEKCCVSSVSKAH